MNTLNFSHQNEDALDSPLFIKFSKIFADNSLYQLNKKISEFETTHPNLTFVSFDDFTRTVPITGEYLFSDKSHRYSKLLYMFKSYREIRYYEPEPSLAEWLTEIDEFAKSEELTLNLLHFKKHNYCETDFLDLFGFYRKKYEKN